MKGKRTSARRQKWLATMRRRRRTNVYRAIDKRTGGEVYQVGFWRGYFGVGKGRMIYRDESRARAKARELDDYSRIADARGPFRGPYMAVDRPGAKAEPEPVPDVDFDAPKPEPEPEPEPEPLPKNEAEVLEMMSDEARSAYDVLFQDFETRKILERRLQTEEPDIYHEKWGWFSMEHYSDVDRLKIAASKVWMAKEMRKHLDSQSQEPEPEPEPESEVEFRTESDVLRLLSDEWQAAYAALLKAEHEGLRRELARRMEVEETDIYHKGWRRRSLLELSDDDRYKIIACKVWMAKEMLTYLDSQS